MTTVTTAADKAAIERQHQAEARLIESAQELALVLDLRFDPPRRGWDLAAYRCILAERCAELMTRAAARARGK